MSDETETKKIPTEEELREEAKTLGEQIDEQDSIIKQANKTKAPLSKKLRSITGQLVTLELKKK